MNWQTEEGPELDMYVAETLLGWQRTGPSKWNHPNGGTGYTSVPAYSSFLIAAWDVMNTYIQYFELHKSVGEAYLWMCKLDGYKGTGKTPALAICRAALLKHEEENQ